MSAVATPLSTTPLVPSTRNVGVPREPVWRIPLSASTLAGFRDWVTSDDFPENVRVTFVEKEIHLDMSNEIPETYVFVKGEVFRVLSDHCRRERNGLLLTDGVLVSNVAAELSTNPDATFLSREGLCSGRVRLIPREGHPGQSREIEGSPDWILEVVSDSSVRKDTEQLRRAYFRAGIREYWIIDARGDTLSFQLLVAGSSDYEAVAVQDGWQKSPVFGKAFRLDRRIDEFGVWEYTLHQAEATSA